MFLHIWSALLNTCITSTHMKHGLGMIAWFCLFVCLNVVFVLNLCLHCWMAAYMMYVCYSVPVSCTLSFSPDWILFTSTTESNFPLSHHGVTQTLDKSFHEWMNWNESTTLIHLAVLCFRIIQSHVPFIFMWITLFCLPLHTGQVSIHDTIEYLLFYYTCGFVLHRYRGSLKRCFGPNFTK